jgi:hypothetical protein
VQVDEPAHLDGSAEGDLAVALGEVQVAHRQLRAGHEDRVEDPAALGQVLDVLVAAVLPRRRRPGRLAGDAVELGALQPAEDGVLREGRQGQRRHPVGIGGDEGALPAVPARQQLRGGRGAHQAGMHDAGERDAGDVPGRGGLPGEVPDHLVRVGELVGEEAAAVLLGEDAGVAPALPGQRAGVLLRDRPDVQDVDDQQVTRFGALHRERAAEHVHRGQRCVPDVVGGVVVVDGAVEPLPAVDPEAVAGTDGHLGRDVRVPPVVAEVPLLGELLAGVEGKDEFGHGGVSAPGSAGSTGPVRRNEVTSPGRRGDAWVVCRRVRSRPGRRGVRPTAHVRAGAGAPGPGFAEPPGPAAAAVDRRPRRVRPGSVPCGRSGLVVAGTRARAGGR